MSQYPKPELLRRIEPEQHTRIEASAGTGKTYTIAHIVLDLVLRGMPIRAILLMTFTEKATAELRARVRALLEKVAYLPPESGEELDPASCWEIGREQRNRLFEALADFDSAPIHTLHGFCNRVLGDYAFENQQYFETEKVSKNQAFEEFLPQFLRKEALGDPAVRRLLLAYLREHPGALVGLDSGEEGARGENLLHLLRDLVSKNATLLPNGGAELETAWLAWRESFDALSLRAQLERLNLHAGTRKSLVSRFEKIATWFETLSADLDPIEAVGCLNELELENFAGNSEWKFLKAKPGWINGPEDIPAELLKFLSATRKLKPFLAPLSAYLTVILVNRLRLAFRKDKARAGRIDFDDMIRLVAERLASEEGAPLIKALRERYRVAIIDEFQDTDPQQWSIFSRLFLESEAHSLLLIGDPKQAIYGFRGADIHTYLFARRMYDSRGYACATLSRNFRSAPELVEALNQIFAVEGFFGQDFDFEPAEAEPAPERRLLGRERAPVSALEVDCRECRDEKGKLVMSLLRHAMAERVADGIVQLLSCDEPLVPLAEGSRRVLPGDIMVLVRRRSEAELMGKALRARGVAFSFFKQAGLFETLEARYLHDLLRAIEEPSEANCFQALLTPFFAYAPGDLMENPVLPLELRVQFSGWREILVRKRDFRALFLAIFSETRIFERLLLLGDDERAVTNYEQLADLLTRAGRGHTLEWLVRRLWLWIMGESEQDQDLLRLETERQAVQLMTKHVSKGLEFPFVFLFGDLGPGRSAEYHEYHDPELGRMMDLGKAHAEAHARERAEEDARLDYVALTRARFGLFLPVVAEQGESPELERVLGGYFRIHQRVTALLNAGHPGFALVPSSQTTCTQLKVDQEGGQNGEPDWCLPSGTAGMEVLRWRSFSLRLASYTRLAGLEAARAEGDGERLLAPPKAADEREEGELAKAQAGLSPAALAALELPGGAATGICLHEILEQLDRLNPHAFAEGAFAGWLANPIVSEILDERTAAAGLEAHREAVARLVWHAARAPLPFGVSLAELAPEDRIAEVDFLYPMRLGQNRTLFLTGSIDLAFRHEGRYYFIDWKSDRLASYATDDLAEKVMRDYGIQIEIYVWAMLRWLGIYDERDYEARFGGFGYLFLRGLAMQAESQAFAKSESDGLFGRSGLYFHRPSWDEAKGYELRLIERLEKSESQSRMLVEQVGGV